MPTDRHILGIETSSPRGSVALLHGDQVLVEVDLPSSQRTAQSLTPAIAEVTQAVGWSMGELEVIAVSQGPGSFTGIRVGVTTAITLAYALDADIIGVDTLECIAAQAPATSGRLGVVIDAQRGQLCAAAYQRVDEALEAVGGWEILERDAWMARQAEFDMVTGPGLAKLEEALDPLAMADRRLWRPTAATVARRGWAQYTTGRRDDPWSLRPVYFRQSAAEEKLQEK